MNIILEPLRSLFETMFNITGDWGIAIILLTICVRVMVLPLTMKQKLSMKDGSELTEKMNELKKKYAHDKEKLNQEMMKYSAEMRQRMSGCLGIFLQAPILMAMFSVVKTIPLEISSVLVPWVTELSVPDRTMIIPIIYILVLSLPNLLCFFKFFRVLLNKTFTKNGILMNIMFGVMLTVKAPVSLGIYFIAGGFITFLEEILISILYKARSNKYKLSKK